jgi:hypothetical protein
MKFLFTIFFENSNSTAVLCVANHKKEERKKVYSSCEGLTKINGMHKESKEWNAQGK